MDDLSMPVIQLKISVGVLAHNEERQIDITLRSLFMQDIFEESSVEVIVVANGCADRTVDVAISAINKYRNVWTRHGSAGVASLDVAGKPNAWNEFVHRLSAREARYLVLMDADILLSHQSVIRSLVQSLESNPTAVVSVDRPVKQIQASPTSYLEGLLVAASPTIDPHNVPLCGQLYCARTLDLRSITIPRQISCDDGFIRALLLTKGFTQAEDRGRIVLAPEAQHTYASVSSLRELYRHERWIVAGSIVNRLLYDRLSSMTSKDRSAMALITEWTNKDPDWLPKYIHTATRRKYFQLLPPYWWIRRFSNIRSFPLSKKLTRLPIALAAACMDALIFVGAIRAVKRGTVFRYWLESEDRKTALKNIGT